MVGANSELFSDEGSGWLWLILFDRSGTGKIKKYENCAHTDGTAWASRGNFAGSAHDSTFNV